MSAGLNTTYYHTLHSDAGESFSNQFKNNMGEYVGATLSIPLFNRLQTITSIRKAKNNYRIAQETYKQKQLEAYHFSTIAELKGNAAAVPTDGDGEGTIGKIL